MIGLYSKLINISETLCDRVCDNSACDSDLNILWYWFGDTIVYSVCKLKKRKKQLQLMHSQVIAERKMHNENLR